LKWAFNGLSEISDLSDLGLCDLTGVDTRHADSRPVNVEHDSGGFGFVSSEDAFEDFHDKFHGGEIVIVNEHFVHGRLLGRGSFFEGQAALFPTLVGIVGGESPGRV